jgi:hypothetical protein
MNRRAFLKNIPRGAIILGLSAVAGIVLFKNENTSPCDYNFLCNKCSQFKDCTLEEAIKYKLAHPQKS